MTLPPSVHVLLRADERESVLHAAGGVLRTFSLPGPSRSPQRAPLGADTWGFGALRSLDENRLIGGAELVYPPDPGGETLTYVLDGALVQEDSAGRTAILRAGEFQTMTLGERVRCRERNASQTERVHFLRLSFWPASGQVDDTREQRFYSWAQRRGLLRVVASPDGRRQSLRLCQDAVVLSAVLTPGRHVVHELWPDRMVWLHLVSGEASLGDVVASGGDGVGVAGELAISITALQEAELLLIDLHRPVRALAGGH